MATRTAASSATNKNPPARKALAKAVTSKAAAVKKTAAAKKKAPPASPPAAGKAPARKAPAARQRAPRGGLGYDPRAQLDKLSDGPLATSRGLDAAPAVDVEGILAELFRLQQDEPLTPALAQAAADELGVEVAALRAIAQVESAGSGFDAKGRPTLLYERHVFARNTSPKGRFNTSHPDISASTPYAKGTFGNAEMQWNKFARAYQLDQEAALKAPSWGTFQILGENFKSCGFADVRAFVGEMFRSQAGHLRALVGFIKANPAIHKGLKNHDWVAVAKGYNGPSYATYAYDKKLQAAYEKFAG